MWHAGALDRIDDLPVPEIDPEQISQGFWHACVAGQRRAAEHLLRAGADLNWEPNYAHGTALDAATGLGTRQDIVIEWLQSIGARSAQARSKDRMARDQRKGIADSILPNPRW